MDEGVIQRYAKLTADARDRGDALWDQVDTGDRWIAATALAINAPCSPSTRSTTPTQISFCPPGRRNRERGWGFTDPSSFTRMFKNAYGMSPRDWRHQANTRRSEPTGETISQ